MLIKQVKVYFLYCRILNNNYYNKLKKKFLMKFQKFFTNKVMFKLAEFKNI